MSLTLREVRRIATDVARNQDPSLEVIGAVPGPEGSSYTEVIITSRANEPGPLIIGARRDISESEFRATMRDQLRRQLEDDQFHI